MTKKPYLSFLTSVRSLYQPILYLKMMTHKERERRQCMTFFLSVLSYSSISQKLGVSVECVHMKKWNKSSWVSFVQSFHSSGKKEIHMHVWAMKWKLCNFSDSTYQVNARIFLFKIDIICRWTVSKLLHLKFYHFFI